jgi:predicted DNA-binding protein with PD1-like motif
MEIVREGPFVMLRLENGEDILESVMRAAKDERSTMAVTTGLGMIADFELGYFDRGTYIRKSFDEPHELLCLQGSVSSEGDNRVHIHATVADKEHRTFGGHLLRGKVWMSNEILLTELDGVRSKRALDPELKVGVLRFVK